MKSNNPRIERLKEMLALEEQRSRLENELAGLSQKLSALKDQLNTESTSTSAPISSPTRSTGKSRGTDASARTAGRSRKSGGLRDKVMAALEAAGNEGVRVKELAEAIGTKPVNIHSWFHSNVPRNPSIKKLSGGHYRLQGSGTGATGKSKAAPKVKEEKAEPAPRKASAKGSKAGSKRGALSANILSELQAAGESGVTVRDLADKLNSKYKNIYIWFATTGKKNPAIEKVGPATYRLAA